MATWNLEGMQTHLLICNGGTCMKKNGEEVTQAIRAEISAHKLDDKIHTTRTKCNGRCKDGCVVIAYPQGNWYNITEIAQAQTLVTDLQALRTQQVYETIDGCLVRTAHTEAVKGVAKKS